MSGKVLTINSNGMTQERPVSFSTVAAAEAASFLPGEICSVLETRRFYQFDASSVEARDGIRVLTPAGGGRLLCAPWAINATEIEYSTPTTHLPNLQAVVSHNWSAALMDGGGFADNGDGTYSLAAAEAALRQPVGGQGATIGLYNVAAVNNQSIADGTQTYITVKLTGSTAAYATQQDLSLITGRDEIEAYSITRVGSDYHVVDLRRQNVDHAQLACRMEWDTKGVSKVQGTAYSSSASNRYLQVSAGKFHVPIRLSATPAFDTSTTSTFTQIHGSTASGWTRTAGQTQINNTNYNDGTGTLATLTANQWGVRWVFMDIDPAGASLSVLIGATNGSEAEANAASLPSDLPPELRRTAPGVLISRIVIQKNAASVAASWISNYDSVTQRQSTPTTEHDSLGGIKGNGFHHLSEAERDAAIRIATASQSGLMSAAQAQVVSAITTDGTGNVGVGNPTIAARLHAKGSGATSATTAFKVDNSSNTELFTILDNKSAYAYGQFNLQNGSSTGSLVGGADVNASTRTNNSRTIFRVTTPSYSKGYNFGLLASDSPAATIDEVAFGGVGSSGSSIPAPTTLYFATTSTVGNSANNTIRMTINKDGLFSIGNGATTIADTRLYVKGSASDSSAYGLKVDNSSNAKNFYVRNDGQVDSSGSRVIGYEEFTSDSTLTQSSKSSVICNPSGAGMVLTMHLSPPGGILQTIVNASAFAVTLGRNSQKIAGIESNYTLPANTSITLHFLGSTLGWLIISQR